MERTRYLLSHVRETDNYGGGGSMVWVGIMFDGCKPHHDFERDSVTHNRYRDEIYVCLFRGACGPTDDNVRPHRALLVDEFLEREYSPYGLAT
ncbi:DDE_3 domain-containing protein [Trichonephila clavipes]|nr:DDE_3 domain-containing protein [Trichonephila clavipes]